MTKIVGMVCDKLPEKRQYMLKTNPFDFMTEFDKWFWYEKRTKFEKEYWFKGDEIPLERCKF